MNAEPPSLWTWTLQPVLLPFAPPGALETMRAGAPDGARVTFALTGDAARDIHVVVDGRAAVVDALDLPASVVITTDVHTFTRLAGGRTRWEAIDPSLVSIDGNTALGAQILQNLAYTI